MTTTFVVRPEALPAWHALGGAIDELTRVGRATPCTTDPAPFTSDLYVERREAAEACSWCPAMAACRRFAEANREPAHVWGGVDRTPTTRGERNVRDVQ